MILYERNFVFNEDEPLRELSVIRPKNEPSFVEARLDNVESRGWIRHIVVVAETEDEARQEIFRRAEAIQLAETVIEADNAHRGMFT